MFGSAELLETQADLYKQLKTADDELQTLRQQMQGMMSELLKHQPSLDGPTERAIAKLNATQNPPSPSASASWLGWLCG